MPVQIYKGKQIPSVDLESSHEEADIILVQQLLANANEPHAKLIAECDDTDVFVALVHFYLNE